MNAGVPLTVAGAVLALAITTMGSTPNRSEMLSRAQAQYGETSAAALYLTPTDDVWVYPHAGNPTKDEFLRAWGSGGSAVGKAGDDTDFSYSYLRWDLSGFPKNAKVAKAELVLTHVPDPEYTLDNAKAAPLQVRPMIGTFSEHNWMYEMAEKVRPEDGNAVVFGTGVPGSVPTGTDFPIVIDLMQGPGDFKAYFTRSLKGDKPYLALALTSTIDPGQLGQKGVYKVYSSDAQNSSVRPVLKIWLERR